MTMPTIIAMLTTITGFVRSTHMTGTVTDIGLLLGQCVQFSISLSLSLSLSHTHTHTHLAL